MSTNNASCACPTPVVTQVPGPPGGAGTNGTNGKNAYSLMLIVAGFNVPAVAGGQVTLTVDSTAWMVVGSYVVVGGAGGGQAGPSTYQVAAIVSTTSVTLTWVNAQGDIAAGTLVAYGAVITPCGRTPRLLNVNQMIDNTGGTAADTLLAGVGIYTVAFYCQLSQITATTIARWTPGHAFKIISLGFAVEVAVTTAAKLATINPAIANVQTTGGNVQLTSANCTPKGAIVAQTAAITAGNIGTSGQEVEIVASAVTPFSEGTGWMLLTLQNTETRDTFASIASHINSIQTLLKS